MSTITEAVAHMEQLVHQGCEYEQAVVDTQRAFELDEGSMDMVESVYGAALWEGIVEDLQNFELNAVWA